MFRVVHELNYLRLDDLSDDWVEGIFYSEFLEFGEIPSEYEVILENIEIRLVFRKIMQSVDQWINVDSANTSEEKSWAPLSHEVNHRKLLALLAYYIDNGGKNIMNQEHRNTALLAARVYFKMLSIPGYKAYHIYHSQLFAQSLGCLSYPKTLCENEDNYFNMKQLTREVNSVIKEVAFFVYDLRAVIEALQLNPEDMNFEDILSNLVEFTGGAIVNKLDIDKIELVNISRVIYELIDVLLCDLNKEPNADAIQLLFKCLLPKLVAASVDNRSANNLVRASYVTYSGLVLTKYGKSALSGFITLLQHLCYTLDGLERAEVRSARVSLIIGLMSLLPQKSYRYIVRWILKLSATAKVAHRHIALELIAQLLNNDAEENLEPVPVEQHVSDVSATVAENPSSSEARQDTSINDNMDTQERQSESVDPTARTDTTLAENEICVDPSDLSILNAISDDLAMAGPSGIHDLAVPGPSGIHDLAVPGPSGIHDLAVPGPSGIHDLAVPGPSGIHDLAMPGPSGIHDLAVPGPSGSHDLAVPGPSGIHDLAVPGPSGIHDLAVPGPSGIHDSAVPGPSSDTNSTIASVSDNQDAMQDSGIQEPSTGIDLECEDFIMSLLNHAGDGLEMGDLPVPIPELGDIGDFSLFGELNGQPNINGSNQMNVEDNEQTSKATEKTAQDSKKKKCKEKKSQMPTKNESSPTNTVQNVSQAAVSTDDESSQDEITEDPEQVSEDDIAGLLRQRPHSAPHAALLRAVLERVGDASSTLRARALSVLAACRAAARAPVRAAVAEINGSEPQSVLMAVAARCVSDERAAVRRAAVTLVQRELGAGEPAAGDLAILVGLCRDASVLVRSAAIAALGEQAAAAPAPAVLDALLAGPLHQLSDPETKIQEQVVTLVQQLILARLERHGAPAGPLPWALLAAVARRNMRRHLQKALAMLAKTASCVNHRTVDIVSTHLGAEDDARDLQCLVLLTSAARLVEYHDLAFLLDYYYRLGAAQDRDPRLMPLTLELLTLWSRFLSLEDRTRLRDHLVARLASLADDGSRIPCATLAAHLAPDDLQWASSLLALSERRAAAGGVHEWLRAADLALVAPAPPSPALLALFLRALARPPPEWTDAEEGACAAGAGRLCVRSRGAAAAVAPALAALLHAPRALPARVNALLALADVSVRYTCIVEPLMGSVCACLDSEAPAALRRAAARALTRLLLGGYLRLRTPLYYRYCALLADTDSDVREPAEYYVTCCLTPDTIYHHFVDCVLHYNSDKAENISFDARQLIYDVMLQRMSLVQKLNIQCRLARDVLVRAADMTEEEDGLTPAMNATLLDTITLLCGPRMKLPKKPQPQGEVADLDEIQERVTTNIVSHKMKRTVAEVLVPAVLRLFARIGLGGGQVAAYLVRIATDLLADYRAEIEELIDNDEELVARVRFFQESIGQPPLAGNARNLVTASAPPEPDTPRAPRRRAPRARAAPPRKRALKI